MKVRTALLTAAMVCLSYAISSEVQRAEPGVPDRLDVSINTQEIAEPVSKYEYGMFIEHIAGTMYRSLWSELIDDRKFYFPISSKDPEYAPQVRGVPAFARRFHHWHTVGPDEVVVMDKVHPFVGDQSPRIELDPSTPHGIRQSALALVNRKQYTGRIYLRGTPGSKVKVSLIWGDGENERQIVSIGSLSNEYKKYPLSFTAKADVTDARFEITGTGTGNFHIGAVSLMPADNLQGFRPDTIAQLRQIKMGFWRYGGNYTSGLTWYHIVGDIDKRPPEFDNAWSAMQTNDLGLDEFITLCKLINVEPYISVNAGFGDSHSAAEEVEYMNGSVATNMGAGRARNGHPAPYHVKYWNIGNEPWGPWQLGRTDLKYFVLKHNEFAKAMRRVDPSIVLIASGQMLQDDTVPGQMRAEYVGNLQPLFGSNVADWTGLFLKESWGNFDGIAEHWYANGNRHFDIEKAKTLPPDASSWAAYVPVDESPLEFARYPANIVRQKAEEWQGYQQRFPAMLGKKTFLSIDEYAYLGGSDLDLTKGVNHKQALAYAMVLNEMLRHTDFLTMAAQTTGVSLLDFNDTTATLNTLGLVYKLYSNRFIGSIPVGLSGNSPQPKSKYRAGGTDEPQTPSGSPTYPLDMVAALSPDHRFLIVSVVNATESEQKFNLSATGVQLVGASKQWTMTAESLQAANYVGHPPQAELNETSLSNTDGTFSVSPISINIFQFPLSEGGH
jgi:alpha-N-arabinofuranosidase